MSPFFSQTRKAVWICPFIINGLFFEVFRGMFQVLQLSAELSLLNVRVFCMNFPNTCLVDVMLYTSSIYFCIEMTDLMSSS